MRVPALRGAVLVAVAAALLLGACAQPPRYPRPAAEPVVIKPIDLMADVPGDRALPELAGEIEQIDCMTGVEDLHARMALKARGGQIAWFAYYSKWRPQTCSVEMLRHDPDIKWRQTEDGATRVQTPHGVILIRAQPHAFVFEFRHVDREKFCGMAGRTNGTMTVARARPAPECSVAGLLDRND